MFVMKLGQPLFRYVFKFRDHGFEIVMGLILKAKNRLRSVQSLTLQAKQVWINC